MIHSDFIRVYVAKTGILDFSVMPLYKKSLSRLYNFRSPG